MIDRSLAFQVWLVCLPFLLPASVFAQLHITNKMSAENVVKLVVQEMNEISRNVLGSAEAFCYSEEQLGHFGLVFVSDDVEQWLPKDFLPLSLQKAWPDGRFYVRIKETSPLLFQYGPATTV